MTTMTTSQPRRDSPPSRVKSEDGPEDSATLSQCDPEENDSDRDGDADNRDGHSSNDEGPARKRRRSRKGLDKKFECPTEGCGKAYSRAEHLHRHQLNHAPKQIYRCDFQDCNRQFVRLDLCNRHKDRHTAKGSTLSRKDSLLSLSSPVDNVRSPYPTPASTTMSPKHSAVLGNKASKTEYAAHHQYQSSKDGIPTPYTPVANPSPAAFTQGVDGYMMSDQDVGFGARIPHPSPSGHMQHAHAQRNAGAYGAMSPASTHPGSFHMRPIHTPQSAPARPFVAPNNFPAFSLPPSDFSTSAGDGAVAVSTTPQFGPTTSSEYGEQAHAHTSNTELMLLDQMTTQATIPMFGPDGVINKSPYISIPEDFVAYLFNTTAPDTSPQAVGQFMRSQYSNYGDYSNPYAVPYSGPDGLPFEYYPTGHQPQQVMAVTNLLDPNLPESILSEDKSREIYDLIKEKFQESNHAPIERRGDSILEGDRCDDNHMLSRKMLQVYIGSYWLHFSDQVPILHKPTFSPDRTPTLLLIAVMAIGAACLDRTSHSTEVMQSGAQLSNFLAWHLRWEIFMDVNCRPPAKLWVFQTMLLLELYEKMYSTRELHERAHIHHATTITLMRRGRSLIGRSVLDSPPSVRDERSGSAGSRQSSASGPVHTADEWWDQWITIESTRRAAFTAFLIDSIHATMFGHSTVMVAHEMRLPLPCDDQLWKATSGAEVGRIESNYIATGTRPPQFLDGLKKTLAGQEVHTNPFGRQILMAGLLSVSWHMNQRDLQVTSLGQNVSQALGGRDKWKGTLMRAFDSWKTEFDRSLQHSDSTFDPYTHDKRNDANLVFESRTVLHHLAHMAMHVDIVDCQIFARAKRLLGRAIGTQDLNSAQRRMKDSWAPSARARDATFYAAKFLCTVLLDDSQVLPTGQVSQNGAPMYCAWDDVLLNRPWVLYFAALVVWCYGFAVAGPCPGKPVPATAGERETEMRTYLRKLGSCQTPDDLKYMRGVNHSSALLAVLKESFASTRWELLHEAATLIDNCIRLNSGATIP